MAADAVREITVRGAKRAALLPSFEGDVAFGREPHMPAEASPGRQIPRLEAEPASGQHDGGERTAAVVDDVDRHPRLEMECGDDDRAGDRQIQAQKARPIRALRPTGAPGVSRRATFT